jgi:bifunctional DNA-binding transcriptional regulator/antitoxin component of YhaV-PrlF toxin-antitoxin module
MITTLKLFGTGQITIPKIWREKYKTDRYIAQETPQGLLLKPLVEELFYEDNEDYFGINFPLGIDAKDLALKLKEANGTI